MISSIGRFGNSTYQITSACNGPASQFYYTNAGATTPTQNPCPAGVYSTGTGGSSAVCSGYCAIGFYCAAGSNSATETQCPSPLSGYTYTTTTLAVGGSSISACVCLAGYYGSGSNIGCTACPTGTYKPAVGTVFSCTFCPLGKYQDQTASVACTSCPAGIQYNTRTPPTLCSGY